MGILDINKPEVIKFLSERYEKAAQLTQQWNNKYGTSLQLAATLHKEKGYFEDDIKKKELELGIASLVKEIASSKRNRICRANYNGTVPITSDFRKEHTIISTGLGCSKCDPRLIRPDTDITPDPIMRPVRPKVKNVLYKDKPDFGRTVYLRCRANNPPEKRYYFAETSSFQYGWRVKESAFGKNSPSYPRVWKLTRDGKSRSGPQPEPNHYNTVQDVNVTKYVML